MRGSVGTVERANYRVLVPEVHDHIHPEDLSLLFWCDLLLADYPYTPRLVTQSVCATRINGHALAVHLDPPLPSAVLHEPGLVNVRETLACQLQPPLIDRPGLGSEREVVGHPLITRRRPAAQHAHRLKHLDDE